MRKDTRVAIRSTAYCATESRVRLLAELALTCAGRGTCHDGVLARARSVLWELTQNPWVVLQTVSRDQLERVLADAAFRKNVDDHLRAKREAAEAPHGFRKTIRRHP